MAGSRKALQPGTRLGNFEVGELLGVGGMGEVYRARDSKLGREVAIKVLPDEFSGNKDRLKRFEREARTLASVNHPSVAVLYGLEREGGTTFLVMEMVTGETLEERLKRGPLPLDESVSMLSQIAEGLEAAHQQGLVHRDMKPANVKMTKEGWVKILDFGLVIGRRLERLDPATPKVLAVAASIGLRFDLAVLEGAAADDPDAVLYAVEEAEGARLVAPVQGRREARYEFVHALVRQTLINTLSVPRKQRLHRKIADAMERVYGARADELAGDIAHHLYQAGAAADPGTTRKYLELAARRALTAAAADEALALVDRALEIDDGLEDAERGPLLYRKGVAYRALGDWRAAAGVWMQALPLLEVADGSELVATICDALTENALWNNEVERAEEITQRGLRAVGDEPSASRCRLIALLGTTRSNALDYRGAERFNTEAIRMAEELGAERLLAGAYFGRLYQGLYFLKARTFLETAERALPIARRAGRPWEFCRILGVSLDAHCLGGRRETLRSLLDELSPLAERHGHNGARLQALSARSILELMDGQLVAARDRCRSFTDLCRELGLPWVSLGTAATGSLEVLLGDREAACAALDDAASHEAQNTFSGFERAHQFLAAARLGDPNAAGLMRKQRHRLPSAGTANPVGAWLIGMATIEAATIVGERREAAALYDCAVQLVDDGVVLVWYMGLAERFAALAAAAAERWELAERHFENALRVADEIPHRVEQPEVRRWYARMLLERGSEGDRRSAESLLSESRAGYVALGMQDHVDLVDSMLPGRGRDIG